MQAANVSRFTPEQVLAMELDEDVGKLVLGILDVVASLKRANQIYGTRRLFREPRLPLRQINRAFEDVMNEALGDVAEILSNPSRWETRESA